MQVDGEATIAAIADPEVEEATRAALTHREAYAARKSTSTRNPHTSKRGRSLEELMKLGYEERVLVQWRTSFGCPISDEAKAQFTLEMFGYTFTLADVRLWFEKHPQKKHQKNHKELVTKEVHLEFFFDGQLAEIQEDPTRFEKAFEDLLDSQLRAKRMGEFKKKLAARRRTRAGPSMEDAEGASGSSIDKDDTEWKAYLHRPHVPTNLSIRAMRDAGCMIRFLVCQSSVSVQSSEELGQLAFPEHFPIDGKEQEIPVSTKPMPKWVYGLTCCTAIMTLMTIFVMWKVFMGVYEQTHVKIPDVM
jgi:hypothetical protein